MSALLILLPSEKEVSSWKKDCVCSRSKIEKSKKLLGKKLLSKLGCTKTFAVDFSFRIE